MGVDYVEVVADLKQRRGLLDGLILGIESLMGAEDKESPAPAAKTPVKHVKLAKKAKPAKKAKSEAPAGVPEEDDIHSKLTCGQAIMRCLNERSLIPSELREGVQAIRPGTTAATIDSQVFYLKQKGHITKDAMSGRFSVVNERMQNGSSRAA